MGRGFQFLPVSVILAFRCPQPAAEVDERHARGAHARLGARAAGGATRSLSISPRVSSIRNLSPSALCRRVSTREAALQAPSQRQTNARSKSRSCSDCTSPPSTREPTRRALSLSLSIFRDDASLPPSRRVRLSLSLEALLRLRLGVCGAREEEEEEEEAARRRRSICGSSSSSAFEETHCCVRRKSGVPRFALPLGLKRGADPLLRFGLSRV